MVTMKSGWPSVRWCMICASLRIVGGRSAPPAHRSARYCATSAGREQLQGQLHRLAVQHQLLLDRLQGMRTQQHLDGPIGAQNEQPGGIPPAGQIRQQVQRGKVAPVQILEHQQQRAADGEHLDRLGQLPQHALRVAPTTRRCTASSVAALSSAGICASQVGACCSNTASSAAPSGPRQSRPSASSTGR